MFRSPNEKRRCGDAFQGKQNWKWMSKHTHKHIGIKAGKCGAFKRKTGLVWLEQEEHVENRFNHAEIGTLQFIYSANIY